MRNTITILLAIVILAFATTAIYKSHLKSSEPLVFTSSINETAFIDYPPNQNYRQTVNDCGPFNTAAVVRALTNKPVDSQKFAADIGWRLPNKYTLPWGLESQLKENGLKVTVPYLANYSDKEKVDYLRQSLSFGHPVILLGQQDNYQHYITIFGFDWEKDEFYIYDPLLEKGEEGLTKDNNADLPGNKTLNSQQILDFWRGGGVYGFYKWYVLEASKN